MKVKELARLSGLSLLAGDGEREVEGGVYCCDLLSMAMGRAPTGSAWITVMCNLNTIVSAMMADTACVIFAEGIRPEETVLARAQQENIAVLCSKEGAYPTAKRLDGILEKG